MAIFDGPDQLMQEAEKQQLLQISTENTDYPVITVIQMKEMIKFLETVIEETDNDFERSFATQTASQLRFIEDHVGKVTEDALAEIKEKTGEEFYPDRNGPVLSFVPKDNIKKFKDEKIDYESPDAFMKRCFSDVGK